MLQVSLAAAAAVAVVPSSNRITLCSSAVGGRAVTTAEAAVVCSCHRFGFVVFLCDFRQLFESVLFYLSAVLALICSCRT